LNRGLDTGFLVALEVNEHALHQAAREKLEALLGLGDRLSLSPQVLAEFIHVVTDARRFAEPLAIDDARVLAGQWRTAREVDHVFPDEEAVRQFLTWHREHRLGRKRLLDTLLAATYRTAGVRSLLTTNPGDFAVLGEFDCITP
jgi:predicted nucleic acid-binding protein